MDITNMIMDLEVVVEEEMVEVEVELENTMMIKVGEEKDINLVVEVQVVRLEMVVLGEVREDMQQAAYMQE